MSSRVTTVFFHEPNLYENPCHTTYNNGNSCRRSPIKCCKKVYGQKNSKIDSKWASICLPDCGAPITHILANKLGTAETPRASHRSGGFSSCNSMLMYVALAYAGLTCCLLGRMLAQSSPFQICLLAQLSIWQDENKTKLWTRLSLYWCFRLFWYDSILDDQHINLPCPSVSIYCKYHNRTYNYSTVVFVLREREREKKKTWNIVHNTPRHHHPPPKKKNNNHPNHPNRPSSSTLNVQGAVRWVGPVAELLTPETVRTASLKWPQLLGPLVVTCWLTGRPWK